MCTIPFYWVIILMYCLLIPVLFFILMGLKYFKRVKLALGRMELINRIASVLTFITLGGFGIYIVVEFMKVQISDDMFGSLLLFVLLPLTAIMIVGVGCVISLFVRIIQAARNQRRRLTY